jgi:hypothetical protein
MTSQEARKITNRNTKTKEEVDKYLLQEIIRRILVDCNSGGNMIFASENEFSHEVGLRLNELGYKIEFQKVKLLIDKSNFKISW